MSPEWKIGKVIWILKDGKDPLLTDLYRPITLLSTLGKLFEKIIAECIYDHIQEMNCIADEQFGFMRGRSCEDAVHAFLKGVHEALPLTNYSVAVSIDIVGAFNNIKWGVVNLELRKMNFPVWIQKMINSYPSDRVAFCGESRVDFTRGCPQGSVLGPLIWIIAYNFIIADLRRPKCKVFCYADDTILLCRGNTLASVKELVSATTERAVLLLTEGSR